MMDRNTTLALRGQILGCDITDDWPRYLRSRARLPERAAAVDWPMLSGVTRTDDQGQDCAGLEAARLGSWNGCPTNLTKIALPLTRAVWGVNRRGRD